MSSTALCESFAPDFLVRLTNGLMLVLEVKGQQSDESRAKRKALEEWVNAVNAHGGFGRMGDRCGVRAG